MKKRATKKECAVKPEVPKPQLNPDNTVNIFQVTEEMIYVRKRDLEEWIKVIAMDVIEDAERQYGFGKFANREQAALAMLAQVMALDRDQMHALFIGALRDRLVRAAVEAVVFRVTN